jgi:hypothetical protein
MQERLHRGLFDLPGGTYRLIVPRNPVVTMRQNRGGIFHSSKGDLTMSNPLKFATVAAITLVFDTLAFADGEPPPPIEGFCHNIGGPQELGANCDGATGTCSFILDTGQTIVVPSNHFLGIVIPPTSEGAIAAHIAHGDGPTVMLFEPPLHLASTGQNHKASNVECLGRRVLPQPPEPGN